MYEYSVPKSFTPVNFRYPAAPADDENAAAPCASADPNATILGGNAETIYTNYLNVSLSSPTGAACYIYSDKPALGMLLPWFTSWPCPFLDTVHWHCGHLRNHGPHVLLRHRLWPLLQVPTGSEDRVGHYHHSCLVVPDTLLHLVGAGNLPHRFD